MPTKNGKEKLEDFGVKFHNARKDLWKKRGMTFSDLEGTTASEKIKYAIKSNVIPKLDYKKMKEDGYSTNVLYFYKMIIDSLPTKPYYRTNRVFFNGEIKIEYINEDEDISNFISLLTNVKSTLLDNVKKDEDIDSFYDKLKPILFDEQKNVKNEYKLILSNTNLIFYTSQLTLNRVKRASAEKQFLMTAEEIEKSRYNIFFYDNNSVKFKKDSYNGDKEYLEIKSIGYTRYFHRVGIPSNEWKENTYFITYGNFLVRDINYDTKEEALAKIDELIKEDLAKEAEESKKNTNRKKNFTPSRVENIERKANFEWLQNDATPDDYLNKIKFKGGEFGNWENQKERQINLNHAFNSFSDVALALGISLESVSGNGKLGIAFGSRGHSKAAAHYEPDSDVINLTRMNGAGALGHEWGHFFDHLIGDEKFASESEKIPEIRELMQIMKYRDEPIKEEEFNEQKEKDIKRYLKALNQYIDSFFPGKDNYTVEQLQKRTELISQLKEDAVKNPDSFMYFAFGSKKEPKSLADLSSYKNELTGRVIQKENRKVLANYLQYYGNASRKTFDSALTKRVNTDYYNGSIYFDKTYTHLGHNYWESDVELFARAFHCYLKDKLAEANITNDYLCGYADCYFTIDSNGEYHRAYPYGEERKHINEAFDKLIAKIKEENVFVQTKNWDHLKNIIIFDNEEQYEDFKDNQNEYATINEISEGEYDLFSDSNIDIKDIYMSEDVDRLTESLDTNNSVLSEDKSQLALNNSIAPMSEKNMSLDKEKSFSEQVDEYINGTLNRYSDIKVCNTPKILLDCGLPQLPMYYTQKHLKNALASRSDSGYGTHYHGLTIEQIKKMPSLLENPVAIYDSLSKNDSIVILTNELDDYGNPIIASVRPNGKAKYELEIIDSNFILSYYGHEHISSQLNRAIADNKVLYINKEKSHELFRLQALQLSEGVNSLDFDKIIHKSNNIVNTTKEKKQEGSANKMKEFNYSEKEINDYINTLPRNEEIKINDKYSMEIHEGYVEESYEYFIEAVDRITIIEKYSDNTAIKGSTEIFNWNSSGKKAYDSRAPKCYEGFDLIFNQLREGKTNIVIPESIENKIQDDIARQIRSSEFDDFNDRLYSYDPTMKLLTTTSNGITSYWIHSNDELSSVINHLKTKKDDASKILIDGALYLLKTYYKDYYDKTYNVPTTSKQNEPSTINNNDFGIKKELKKHANEYDSKHGIISSDKELFFRFSDLIEKVTKDEFISEENKIEEISELSKLKNKSLLYLDLSKLSTSEIQLITEKDYTNKLEQIIGSFDKNTSEGKSNFFRCLAKDYSLTNNLILYNQCQLKNLTPNCLATYAEWKKDNVFVKKGEKALPYASMKNVKRYYQYNEAGEPVELANTHDAVELQKYEKLVKDHLAFSKDQKEVILYPRVFSVDQVIISDKNKKNLLEKNNSHLSSEAQSIIIKRIDDISSRLNLKEEDSSNLTSEATIYNKLYKIADYVLHTKTNNPDGCKNLDQENKDLQNKLFANILCEKIGLQSSICSEANPIDFANKSDNIILCDLKIMDPTITVIKDLINDEKINNEKIEYLNSFIPGVLQIKNGIAKVNYSNFSKSKEKEK